VDGRPRQVGGAQLSKAEATRGTGLGDRAGTDVYPSAQRRRGRVTSPVRLTWLAARQPNRGGGKANRIRGSLPRQLNGAGVVAAGTVSSGDRTGGERQGSQGQNERNDQSTHALPHSQNGPFGPLGATLTAVDSDVNPFNDLSRRSQLTAPVRSVRFTAWSNPES
jgi:hypothetical protein